MCSWSREIIVKRLDLAFNVNEKTEELGRYHIWRDKD